MAKRKSKDNNKTEGVIRRRVREEAFRSQRGWRTRCGAETL
jgi:hypothetical protein